MRKTVLAFLLLMPAPLALAGKDEVFEKAFSLEGVSRISVQNVNGRIEAFVGYLVRTGVRLAFVLPPIHPAMLSVLRDGPWGADFRDTERFFVSFAAEHHIPMVGSFDGAVAGCSVTDFYDAIHPTEPCIVRVIGTHLLDVNATFGEKVH